MQVGQHPAPTHVLAHVSDTHFLGGRRPLYDRVDSDRWLCQAMGKLESYAPRLDAMVFTGDITDLGEPDAYRRLRDIVEPTAARLSAELVWVMGNHDDRAAFRTELLRAAPSTEPAPNGTLLAMHHPPVPTPMPLMQVLELLDQHRLTTVVRGTDVRAVLGGHLHYSTTGTFAGVPVSVAASTCYTVDTTAPLGRLLRWDGAQAMNLVHVFADQVVHTVAPLGAYQSVGADPGDVDAVVPELSAGERIERFSRHDAR